MSWHKAWRVGIKWGKFVLVYEQIIDKLKPEKQIKAIEPKQLKGANIDTYI
jgi:hypothetical protein